jgi:hypothetical protein
MAGGMTFATILGKLIDYLLTFEGRSLRNRKQVYDNFVSPVQEGFKAVHDDYWKSFQRYREMCRDTAHKMDLDHPLIDTIRNDSRQTEHLRAEVLDPGRDWRKVNRKYPAIREYLKSIQVYFWSSYYLEGIFQGIGTDPFDGERRLLPPIPNTPRRDLGKGLESILKANLPDEEKRRQCTQLIDEIVELIQRDYRIVLQQYLRVKEEMLLP